MTLKTRSRGAAISISIGPSSCRLRPQPRSRLRRPIASSRKPAAQPAIRRAPSTPTAIQSPVVAITTATKSAPASRSPARREDRVADRASGDRLARESREPDRLVDTEGRAREAVHTQEPCAPQPFLDSLDERHGVVGSVLDGGQLEAKMGEQLLVSASGERRADACDRRDRAEELTGQALRVDDDIGDRDPAPGPEHAPHLRHRLLLAGKGAERALTEH